MKQWNVKVGFVGGEKKILYVKNYSVKAETKEIAAFCAFYSLSLDSGLACYMERMCLNEP